MLELCADKNYAASRWIFCVFLPYYCHLNQICMIQAGDTAPSLNKAGTTEKLCTSTILWQLQWQSHLIHFTLTTNHHNHFLSMMCGYASLWRIACVDTRTDAPPSLLIRVVQSHAELQKMRKHILHMQQNNFESAFSLGEPILALSGWDWWQNDPVWF